MPTIGRHPLPPNERKFELGHLYAVHKEILRRLVLGQKPKDIAEALGVTRTVVTYTQNSELGRQHMRTLEAARDAQTADVSRAILETAPESLSILQDLQRDEDTPRALRARVAFGILDRGGYGPTKKSIIDDKRSGTGGIFSQKDIEALKQRALEQGKIVSVSNAQVDAVDAEVVDG